jgi:hypothetical protein
MRAEIGMPFRLTSQSPNGIPDRESQCATMHRPDHRDRNRSASKIGGGTLTS